MADWVQNILLWFIPVIVSVSCMKYRMHMLQS